MGRSLSKFDATILPQQRIYWNIRNKKVDINVAFEVPGILQKDHFHDIRAPTALVVRSGHDAESQAPLFHFWLIKVLAKKPESPQYVKNSVKEHVGFLVGWKTGTMNRSAHGVNAF